MFEWLGVIIEYISKVWNWASCYFDRLLCQLKGLLIEIIDEILSYVAALINVIPIPSVLENFEWPYMNTMMGAVIADVGVPQALSLLAAAFLVRFLKGLIPLIRS